MGKEILYALVFLVIAVGFVAAGYAESQSADEVLESAVEVEAEVVDHELDSFIIDDREYYEPDVVYEYTYDGQQYRSSGIYAGSDTQELSYADAQAVLDRYPIGANTTAYVVPDDPSTSFLEPETSDVSLRIYLGGVVFGVLGIAIGSVELYNRHLRDRPYPNRRS